MTRRLLAAIVLVLALVGSVSAQTIITGAGGGGAFSSNSCTTTNRLLKLTGTATTGCAAATDDGTAVTFTEPIYNTTNTTAPAFGFDATLGFFANGGGYLAAMVGSAQIWRTTSSGLDLGLKKLLFGSALGTSDECLARTTTKTLTIDDCASGAPTVLILGSGGNTTVSLGASASLGFYFDTVSGVGYKSGGNNLYGFTSTALTAIGGQFFGFTNGTNPLSGLDTGMERVRQAVVGINNGTAGGNATLSVTNYVAAGATIATANANNNSIQGAFFSGGVTFGQLSATADVGTMVYCRTCTPASAIDQTCTLDSVANGNGSLAVKAVNGWKCIS